MAKVTSLLLKSKTKEVSVKVPIEAGLLARGALRRLIDSNTIKIEKSGVRISYTESRGLLSSNFKISLAGPANKILGIIAWLDEYMD